MKCPREDKETKENWYCAVRLLRALMSLNCPDGPHLGLPTTLPLTLMDGMTALLTLPHRCAPSVCHRCLLGPHCCPVTQLGNCRRTPLWWGSHCLVPAPFTAPYLGAAACAMASPHSNPSQDGQPQPRWATPQLPQAMGSSLPSLPKPAP